MTPDVEAVSAVEYVALPAQYTDQRISGIGMVAPFDFALDDECRRWLPETVPLYVTRTERLDQTAVTVDLAHEVGSAQAVVPGVRSLLSAEPLSIVYACTSGSFVSGMAGEAALRQEMEVAGALNAVTTSGALLDALSALNITRVAVATPYNETLTASLVDFLAEAGVQVVRAGYLDSERDIMHITYDSARAIATAVNTADAQAIFFSCTNLHTFDIITELEAQLGKPVLSANQVTMWAALRRSGIALPPLPQRLFSDPSLQALL